jgi:hypothetical protein
LWERPAARDGTLFVADSYNNKIKRLDPRRLAVTTWLGTGLAGRTPTTTGSRWPIGRPGRWGA